MILYMVGKLAPNSPHFIRGLVKYVPGRGYFRSVPSQNGNKFATSPTPPIVERLARVTLLPVTLRRNTPTGRVNFFRITRIEIPCWGGFEA